jgi:hypothetical protein
MKVICITDKWDHVDGRKEGPTRYPKKDEVCTVQGTVEFKEGAASVPGVYYILKGYFVHDIFHSRNFRPLSDGFAESIIENLKLETDEIRKDQ